MHNLNKWLAAMPPASEIHERIEELEHQLAFLRLAAQAAPTTTDTDTVLGEETRSIATARPLSPDRAAIARIVHGAPKRVARPAYVGRTWRRLGKDISDRAVGTTMQRMAQAGQLDRLGKGLYKLPPHIAAQMQDLPDLHLTNGHGQVVMTS